MSKPCEYCGCDLPVGVDKKTRQVRSHHFVICTARPKKDNYEAGKREWVGLTEKDAELVYEDVSGQSLRPQDYRLVLQFAVAIEAKLKELNHD